MKTTLALIFTLIFAAISASAWAMPCAQTAGALQEVRDSQHQVRLHVAQQHATESANDTELGAHPSPFKAPGKLKGFAV